MLSRERRYTTSRSNVAPRRAVNGGRHSADDDELDAGLGESPKQRLEIRDHVAAARPARSSSTNACNCMSVSRRSSTER